MIEEEMGIVLLAVLLGTWCLVVGIFFLSEENYGGVIIMGLCLGACIGICVDSIIHHRKEKRK